MGILDNFENAWNPGMQYESTPMKPRNNAGELSLTAKLFSETCCDGCGCKTSTDHNLDFVQDIIDFEQ